jgi:hypothetical protein
MVDRLQGIEPTTPAEDAAGTRSLTGTGEVWPDMEREGSYDLMGGANYAGPEEFVGTLTEAIDQWMGNRRGGPSDARTPLWADGLEPDDPVIWTYASDDVDGDGIPLLTRSDVEAAFEARGIPSGGDLDATRNRDRIERGPEDTRSAQEIFDAEYTEGPTGEPGASAARMKTVDLDTLDEEVQGARAHYRAMVEEPEQDPASVEDQLGVGEEIESLHRTRPHELRDMSTDELNRYLEEDLKDFIRNEDLHGSANIPARSIKQELAIRDIIDNLLERLDSANETYLHPGTLRELAAWGFGENNVGRLALVGSDEEQFNEAAVLFHALSRLAEDGRLDGIGGIYSQMDGTITVGEPGDHPLDSQRVIDLKTQVENFGNNLYGGLVSRTIGDPPGLTPGSQEAAMAKMSRGRYLKESHLRTILEVARYPRLPPAWTGRVDRQGHAQYEPEMPDWQRAAWQQMAFLELARREARDFDLNIPMEQRSQFHRSLRERARLGPEPLGKEELVALAMRRLRLAENERDDARLGQQFGEGLVGAVSDRHYLDDVEGRPRSETPPPTFAEGDEITTEDMLGVFEGPVVRRPDEELHARAMETPKERRAGKRTAEEEADERLDELIASIDELSAGPSRFEEEARRGWTVPEVRGGGALMSRRDSGLASHRDMSKQRAARNPKDRSLIKQSSPFFKIVYDSLGVEIKKEQDPVKRKALEKLKKSFEYFNSSSIRYGPDNPLQTSDGEIQIDNDAIPDITDALFDVLGRWTRKSTVSEIDRKRALINYLEAIDEVGGRTHPEVESMMPLRIAAIEIFLKKLVERGMDIL